MNIKLIVAGLFIASVYYVVAVRHCNPFAHYIEDDIPLRKFDGELTTMKDLAGENGTIIVRLTTTCVHCISQVRSMAQLGDSLRKFNVNIIAIVGGPDNGTIKKWAEMNEMPWSWKRVYWYSDLYDDLWYKEDFVPYIIYRDRDHKIFRHQIGVTPVSEIIDAIGNMLETYDEFKDINKAQQHIL